MILAILQKEKDAKEQRRAHQQEHQTKMAENCKLKKAQISALKPNKVKQNMSRATNKRIPEKKTKTKEMK